MQHLSKINIAWISPQNRALLWVLLILLSVALLLFPVHLINEYQPIQAPYLFDNLPLFGALFCIWMLLLLFLVFSKQDNGKRLNWENLALACVFGVVFLGFWVVITPYGSYADGIYNMGHVRWLVQEGSVPVGHPSLIYFDFPGMHLLVSAISQFTGLGVFESRTPFMIFNVVLFSALMYILFVKLLKSNRLAFLGVLLVILGSVLLVTKMHILTPGALGFTLLAGFLVVLTRSETKLFGTTASDRLLMLILFIAMTISYFATSFLAPLILLGIYVVQMMGRDTESRASPATIALLMIIVIAWEVYWTWQTFDSLAMFLPKVWGDVLAGEFITTALTLGSANIGGTLPLWANITHALWWALLGFGTILGLYNLFRVRKLSLAEKVATGGLLGVILLTLIGIFGTAGGYQFTRFLLYTPLFCAPILLMFLHGSKTLGRWGLALVIVLVFALALPTFLSSVNTVSTDAIYPYECAAGEFMESNSDEESEGHIVYGLTAGSTAWAYYYIPDTLVRRVTRVYYVGSEDEVWQEVDKLVTRFQHEWTMPGKQKVLVISEKTTVIGQHLLGIPRDHPRWEELRELLSSTNRIYNNGHVLMYGQIYLRH